MNAVVKFLIGLSIVTAISVVLQQFSNILISNTINESIIYFLSQMGILNSILPMDAIFNAMRIFSYLIYCLMIFYVMHWIAKLVSR